jgi:16S rRNA A1518/A1519 N6-dimethyltransferase RsmA/KsgA/DIM1 with predicted DNA glycosylase/AP lyase activity
VAEGDVVVDAGAAEGNFALSVIDKASKVYIIEGDAGWCEALRQTFLPYNRNSAKLPIGQ